MAAPTLVDLDGFAHATLASSQAGSGFIGTYDTVQNGGTSPQSGLDTTFGGWRFDTTVKRNAANVCSLKMVQDGITTTALTRNITATGVQVVSFYIRMTAHPAGTSTIFTFKGATVNAVISVNTSGQLTYRPIGGSAQTITTDITDSNWHRIDAKFDSSTNTYTLDVQLDGSAGTQATFASTAANSSAWALGTTAAADTATAWFQDVVVSATSGDYPIGGHQVLPLYPVGEGTDNLLGHIADQSGGTTNLWAVVDDWNGGVPTTADYLHQTVIDASAFAEFTLGTVTSTLTVWDVIGIIAGFASTTGADTADTQVLTAHGGTLIDHIGNLIDYSGSTTVLGYYRHVLARIGGGWTPSNLSAAVVQWGRSTDVTGEPRLDAVMLEYAVAQAATSVGFAQIGSVATVDRRPA